MCGLDGEEMSIKMEDEQSLGNETFNFATPKLEVFIKVENEVISEDGTNSTETLVTVKEEDGEMEEEVTGAEGFVKSSISSLASFVETTVIKKEEDLDEEEEPVAVHMFVETSYTNDPASVTETSFIKTEKDLDCEEEMATAQGLNTNNGPASIAETSFIKTEEGLDCEEETAAAQGWNMNSGPASVVETVFIKTEDNSDWEEEEVTPQAFVEVCTTESGTFVETSYSKKEDSDGEEEEEAGQTSVESDFRPFYGQQKYLRCNDNTFQIAASDDGLDPGLYEDGCSVSSSVETQESFCKMHKYRAYDDSSSASAGSNSQPITATKAETRMNHNSRKRPRTQFIHNYFPCVYCHGEFETEDGLQDHLKRHVTLTKSLPCDRCFGQFNTEHDFQEHLKSYCNLEERIGNKRKYNLREKTLFTHKPFPCVYCRDEFETENDLKDHLKTHAMSTGQPKVHINADLLPCAYCSGEFRTEDDLKEHLKSHIKLEAKKAEIRMQNTWKNWRECLDTHFKFPCTYCSNEFEVEDDLKDHLKTHAGHSKIHIQAKLLPCAYCSGKFRTEDDLKDHLKTHVNSKGRLKVLIHATLLPCVYCLSEFETEDDLKEHLKTHIFIKRS